MPSTKASRNRQLLITKIRLRGVIIIFYYVRCQKSESDYIRSRDSSSCLRYIKNRKSCEIELFSKSDFIKVDKEYIYLDIKKDRANEETEAYYIKINTALTKTV
jgi:hypothetical protein